MTVQSFPGEIKMQLHKVRAFCEYNFGVFTGRRDPLIPPYTLHGIGNGDYIKTGEEFFNHFVSIAEIQPNERILEVGCGTGRMARPLTKYLKDGHYDGMDIVSPSINWCSKAYTGNHPNFHFHFSDIYNKEYNPSGKVKASEYRFPFEDSSFDFVFLTSVFTHMFPPDVENYISEISRVLKKDGRCFITYFLLNTESLGNIKDNRSSFNFEYELEGCRTSNKETPEAAIAYDENKIRELYNKYKLDIAEPIKYGTWCGKSDGLSYQDIVFAKKTTNF